MLNETDTVESLLGRIEEARASLYGSLRSSGPTDLSQRPAPGEWSIIENVRHLLYAEQLHLGRVLLGTFKWSPLALPTDGKPRRNGAGTRTTEDIKVVLTAWDAIHRPIRDAVQETDQARRALDRNLRHLRAHVRIIQRLLDEQVST